MDMVYVVISKLTGIIMGIYKTYPYRWLNNDDYSILTFPLQD
jgi:hypothetical protein